MTLGSGDVLQITAPTAVAAYMLRLRLGVTTGLGEDDESLVVRVRCESAEKLRVLLRTVQETMGDLHIHELPVSYKGRSAILRGARDPAD